MKQIRSEMYNSYYYLILQNKVSEKIVINGWEFDMESMVGSFVFLKDGMAVYATPYWEGEYGVNVQYSDEGFEYRDIGNFDIVPCGDSEKDSKEYFESIVEFLDQCDSEEWSVTEQKNCLHLE